jgi:TP901-1 family phage major tail protein
MKNGIDFTISVNGTKIAGQQGGSLSRNQENLETTNKDSNGWKTFIPSFKDWSVEGEGLVVFSDQGYQALETAYVNGDLVTVDVMLEGSQSLYQGEAILSELSLDMPYDDLVTYTVSLQGSGELTFTAPTTPAV